MPWHRAAAAAMAYAYLFKYIIIGDTGEALPAPPGTAGRCGQPLRPARAGQTATGADPARRLPPSRPRRSISAVLELVTWALRAAAAWPGLHPGRAAAPALATAAPGPAVCEARCRGRVTAGTAPPARLHRVLLRPRPRSPGEEEEKRR